MRTRLALVVLAFFWHHATASEPAESQAILDAFSEPAVMTGGPLWITLLTNASIEVLWGSDAARDTLQIEIANAGTAFYVVGVATRALSISPMVSVHQDGSKFDGTVVNVSYLNGETVPEGSVVLGLLEFDSKVDIARPFVLELGGAEVEFAIDPELAARWGEITMPSGAGF